VAVPLPISIYYFAFVYIFAYPHRGLWLRGCTARVVVLHLCADGDEREFSGCNFLSTIRGYDKQSIVLWMRFRQSATRSSCRDSARHSPLSDSVLQLGPAQPLHLLVCQLEARAGRNRPRFPSYRVTPSCSVGREDRRSGQTRRVGLRRIHAPGEGPAGAAGRGGKRHRRSCHRVAEGVIHGRL
jgi:hypothetical protein